MQVVFLEDVAGVAQGGDLKEVKNGFARNYLIPKKLAAPATHNVLQQVESLRKQAETTRIKQLADMRKLAEGIDGLQINVEMRAGTSGRLYGSVTNSIVAEELSKATGHLIERRTVEINEPIRQVGIFNVNVRLHPEVHAAVKVLVYGTGSDPTEMEAKTELEPGESSDEEQEDGDIDTVVETTSEEDDAELTSEANADSDKEALTGP